MSLIETIGTDFKQAFKGKNESVTSVLRLLKSVIKNEEINAKKELSDDEIIKVIKTEIKKRKDSVEEYQKADRQELADKELQEIEILEKYLPAQLSEEQISFKVDEVLASLSDADKENFGKVMGAVMQQVGQNADGNSVRQILQQKLSV